MKKINRAGLVPYYYDSSGNIQMYFMVPSLPQYGGDKPQCCKGKIEKGETSKQAAIREAKEELGLFESNILGEVHHVGNFLGRTEMYVCEIEDPGLFGVPHFETSETHWLTEEEFYKIGRELHHSVINSVIQFIRTLNE